jgi:hypothetical protein
VIEKLFRKDLSRGRFGVKRVTIPHFNFAENLVRRLSPIHNLRTLDSLQLATVMALNASETPVIFVCSDLALINIAKSEGLTVLNPETAAA